MPAHEQAGAGDGSVLRPGSRAADGVPPLRNQKFADSAAGGERIRTSSSAQIGNGCEASSKWGRSRRALPNHRARGKKETYGATELITVSFR